MQDPAQLQLVEPRRRTAGRRLFAALLLLALVAVLLVWLFLRPRPDQAAGAPLATVSARTPLPTTLAVPTLTPPSEVGLRARLPHIKAFRLSAPPPSDLTPAKPSLQIEWDVDAARHVALSHQVTPFGDPRAPTRSILEYRLVAEGAGGTTGATLQVLVVRPPRIDALDAAFDTTLPDPAHKVSWRVGGATHGTLNDTAVDLGPEGSGGSLLTLKASSTVVLCASNEAGTVCRAIRSQAEPTPTAAPTALPSPVPPAAAPSLTSTPRVPTATRTPRAPTATAIRRAPTPTSTLPPPPATSTPSYTPVPPTATPTMPVPSATSTRPPLTSSPTAVPPTATPTVFTPSPSPTHTPLAPTGTVTSTPSPSPLPTVTSTATWTITPTRTPSVTPTPTPCYEYNWLGGVPSPIQTPIPGLNLTLVPGSRCDNCTVAVALPFAFPLYERTFTSAVLGSNGTIGFVNNTNSPNNVCLTGNPNLSYTILPYWDYMNLVVGSGGGIYTGVAGVPGSRVVAYEWRFNCDSLGEFCDLVTVYLYEGDGNGRLEIIYRIQQNSTGGTAGLQRVPGQYAQFFCNTPNGLPWRLTIIAAHRPCSGP